MNLAEKYRPTCYSEFIGDKTVLETLESYVLNDIPAVLVGSPGIGKTTAVYLVAKKLGYSVTESNASDQRKTVELKELKRMVGMTPLFKTLYLLDEVDGVENKNLLLEVIKASRNPIVMTANDSNKLSLAFKKQCKVIEVELKKQYLYDIVKRMKEIAEKEKLNVTYDRVTTDIRSSINATFYDASKYTPEPNHFEKVNKVFKEGSVEDIPLIWLVDNVTNFYYGTDVYVVMKTLALVAETGDTSLLSLLPRARKGSPRFPYYLRRLKNVRR